ncbi:MAG: hypothetical protein ACP5LQ_08545 [Candidatus Methanodesulfokora sp.]
MQQSLAERVMDEIEADKRLRKRLAELIVSELEQAFYIWLCDLVTCRAHCIGT